MTDAFAGWQAATIEAVSSFTPSVRRIVLRPERWRPFLPGQHLDVRLTAFDGYQARRSYSITSAPEATGTFELAIERLPDGEVSSYFHDIAEPGDRVEVSGPFAEHFVWRADEPGAALLIGGGSGIAPLLSMVRHRAFAIRAPLMTLVYAARTWDDVIARDELLSQESSQNGLRVLFCLSRDDVRRAVDYDRRIDRGILHAVLHAEVSPQRVFVCGNNGFVGTVTDGLVDLGVEPSAIRTERYGG